MKIGRNLKLSYLLLATNIHRSRTPCCDFMKCPYNAFHDKRHCNRFVQSLVIEEEEFILQNKT